MKLQSLSWRRPVKTRSESRLNPVETSHLLGLQTETKLLFSQIEIAPPESTRWTQMGKMFNKSRIINPNLMDRQFGPLTADGLPLCLEMIRGGRGLYVTNPQGHNENLIVHLGRPLLICAKLGSSGLVAR